MRCLSRALGKHKPLSTTAKRLSAVVTAGDWPYRKQADWAPATAIVTGAGAGEHPDTEEAPESQACPLTLDPTVKHGVQVLLPIPYKQAQL